MTTRPASIVVARLGAKAAAQLSAIAGGTRLRVPTNLDHPGHNSGTLRRRLGDDLFVLVVLHFGGSTIYVPAGTRSEPVDVRKVKRLVGKGWSSARIARELKCSERTVDTKRAQLRSRARVSTPRSGE